MCYVSFCLSVLTFSPLALLMALSGLRTRRTLRIFTTLIALDLQNTWDLTTDQANLNTHFTKKTNLQGWNNTFPREVLIASVFKIFNTNCEDWEKLNTQAKEIKNKNKF